MKKKIYNIRVKLIYETEMKVSEKSMYLALLKFNNTLQEKIKDDGNLKNVFENRPTCKYKVNKCI